MKKILFTLFLSMISFFVQANHLQFMGIPIDGPYRDFIEQIRISKGFDIIPVEYPSGPSSVYYEVDKGLFAGKKVCLIHLGFSEITSTVHTVQISCKHESEEDANSFCEFVKKNN